MRMFNNIMDIVRNDIVVTMKNGSKVSIAAACFSMCAYNDLNNSWRT
jgi:hypothetical protein